MVELTMWMAAASLAQAVQAPPRELSKASPPSVDEVIIMPPKARQEPEWAARLNFDIQGRYRSSGTPYLRQRPHQGMQVDGRRRDPSDG